MLGKLFDKLLYEGEDSEIKKTRLVKPKKKRKKFKTNHLVECSLVFLVILLPRVYYMFYLSNPNFPGWYTDTFHHWQIGFLSKEVGFKQGFLRLWDFKGMEFFWGLLHPLVLAILFWLTGSISILVPRLLSLVAGSLAYTLLFLLIKRYFNRVTAWAVVVFTAFFPITLFSNTVGMQEELGLLLIFGGLLLWPRLPIMTGLFWALASMVRAEYWLFCGGLIVGTVLLKRHSDKAVLLIVGYGLVMMWYMKYLVNWTGSHIFPIRLNFLASVKGEWFRDLPIVGEKLLAKRISQGIFGVGFLGSLATLLKRPRYGLLWLFGFGNILFIGFMIGFGSYVKGYIPRFWVDRLYNWPYLFSAIVVISLIFYYLPNKLEKLKPVGLGLAWLVLLVGLWQSQRLWKVIDYHMQPVAAIYNAEKSWAAEIAVAYEGGRVLLPEDRPYITYFLAHDYGIKGENMEGQMFDPFFYFENKEEPFNNWGEDREIVLNWLKEREIQLIALTVVKPTYLGLIERETEYFEEIESDQVMLYRVKLPIDGEVKENGGV